MKETLKRAYRQIDGSTPSGMRNRTWCAIILTLITIASDALYVHSVYGQIPEQVPGLIGWNNEVLKWAHKSAFWSYEWSRIAILVVMLALGYGLTLLKPHSSIARRTRCFLAEVAFLIIFTGVSIGLASLALSLGDQSSIDSASDYWQWTIMLVWFVLSLAEYLNDVRKLRNVFF